MQLLSVRVTTRSRKAIMGQYWFDVIDRARIEYLDGVRITDLRFSETT